MAQRKGVDHGANEIVSELRYETLLPITRLEAEKALSSGDTAAKIYALLRSAHHDPDWRWVQDTCIEHALNADFELAYTATICFGHLARIHGALDLNKVMPVLTKLRKDPAHKGVVEDIIQEIRFFTSDRNDEL